MNSESHRHNPLSLSICLGWASGTVGMFAMHGTANVLLLNYLTDYLGVAAAMAGTIIALSKIYDAVSDPIIGLLSDRTSTRIGRRRPYLAAGAVLCGLSMVLLFNTPSFGSTSSTIFYIVILLLVFATSYTLFNVPYMAMSAEMTEDYHQRSRLMSFRVYGVAAGSFVGGTLAPFLIDAFGAGLHGHSRMSMCVGAIIVGVCLVAFFATKNAPYTRRPAARELTLARQATTIIENAPFVRLMICKTLMMTGLSVYTGALAYFMMTILERSYSWISVFSLSVIFGLIASQPLWLSVARRWQKTTVYFLAAGLFTPVMLSWALADASEPAAVFIVRCLLLGAASGGMLFSTQAMLPDSIEYDYRRTGQRREGIFAGFYTTVEKGAAAVGIAFTGLILGAMGYVESSVNQTAAQPQSALQGIVLCMTAIPAGLTVLSCLPIIGYKLSPQRLRQMADGQN